MFLFHLLIVFFNVLVQCFVGFHSGERNDAEEVYEAEYCTKNDTVDDAEGEDKDGCSCGYSCECDELDVSDFHYTCFGVVFAYLDAPPFEFEEGFFVS